MDGRPMDCQPALYEGRVVEVSDPHNFWIQIAQVGGLDDFRQLSTDLSLFAERVGTLTSIGGLEKGVHVLVQSKDKDKPVWMRAQISRINHKREEIDVFFNDYGQMEKVSCTQICSACPHFYFLLPWQAWKCGLAGIRPISQTWPHRAIRQFKIIVMDQVLRVAIIAYHSLVQFVALYTLQGESVAHMLLKEEMAQEDNIELVPRTASEVVYVLPEAYMQQARMMEAGYDEDADGEAAVHQAGQGEVSEEMDVAQLYPQVREGGEELGERRSSSRSTPGAVIPEFDMGLISSTKKTDEKMLRMELERRKFMEAKHHLDKEMLQAKQGVPEEALAAVTDLAWGMKDEHLMKDGWVSHQEVATRISQEIRKADDMWEKELAQRPPPSQKSSSSGKKRGDLGQKGSPNHSPGARGPVRRKLDYQQKPAASVVMVSASASTASAPAASAKVNANLAISPSAPAPLRTKTISNLSDEERSILVASFAACLDEQDNDAEIAKWSLSAYVQPDEKEQPKGLDILLEFLVGEAVHCPEREDMCLSIISSYSDSYNAGTLLAQALWRLSNDFMMMPASGKNPLCKRFGRVVGKLSLSSHQWAYRNHEVLAAETLELLALWLEKCLESLKEGRAGTVSRQFEVLLEGAMELWRQGQLSLEPSSTTATIHQLLKQLLVVDQLDRPRREQLLKMLLSSWDSVKLESMPPKLMKEMVRKAKPPCAEKSTQTPDPRLSHASCQTEEVQEPRRGGLDRQNSQPGYGQGRTTPVTTPSLWAYRTWVGNVDQAGATIGCSSLLEKYNISNFLVSDLAVQDAQNHEHNTESDEDRDLDNEDFREQHQTAYDREEMGSPESEGPYYEDQDDGDAAEHSGYGQEGEDQEYGEPMAPPGEREEVYGTAHIQESNFYEDDEIYNSDEEGSYQEEDDDKPSADQRDGDSFERRDAENDHTSQASKWSQYARDLQSGDGNVPVDEEDSDRWHYDEGNALPSDLRDKCTVEDGSPSKAQPQGSGEDSPFEMLEDYPYDQIEEEPISADAEYTDQPPNLQGSKAAPDELYSPWPHSDAESAKPGRPQEGHWENVTPGRGFQRHLPGLHRSAALRAHWDPMPMFTTKTLAAMMLPSPKPAPIQPPPAEASPEEEPPVEEEEEEEEEEDPPLQPVQMSMSPSFPPDQGPGVPGAGGPEVMSWSKLLSSSTSASSGAPYSFQHGSLSRFVAPRGRDNSAARMMSMQVPAGLKRTYEERSKLKHVENPSPSPTLEHSFSASSQLVESPEKEEENLEPIPTQGKQSSHPVEQLPALGLGHPVPADAFSPWLLQPPQVAPIQIPVTKLGQFGAIGSRKPQYRERGRGRSQAPHPNMLPHPQWDSPPRHGRGVYPDWKYEYEHLGMRDQAPEEQKPKPKPRVDPSSKLLIQEYLRDSDNKQKGQESEFPTLMDANPAPIAIGVVDSSAGKPADTMASIAFDLLGDGSGRRGGGGDNGSNSSGGGGGIGSGGGGGGGLGANGGVSMEGRTQGPAAALDGAMKWSSHGEGDVNYMGPGRLPAYAESMPWNTFRPIQLPDGRDQEGFGTKDFQYPDHRETFDSPRLRNGVELVRSPKDWQAPGARREPLEEWAWPTMLIPAPLSASFVVTAGHPRKWRALCVDCQTMRPSIAPVSMRTSFFDLPDVFSLATVHDMK